MKYEVIVGNLGSVHQGDDLDAATAAYFEYRKQSVDGYGRAGGEDVTLTKDGEPYVEYAAPEPPEAD